MIRLDAETGIALSSILTVLLVALAAVNLAAGNTYLAVFNVASAGLGAFILTRWVKLRRRRRRLEI